MKNPQITLSQGAIETIYQDGLAIYPNECCGFLYGREVQGQRIVQYAIPVENKKVGDQRRRFEITPLQYLKAEQYALENELQLLGIYHSHPDHPAIASEHDLAKALPYFSYVIVSVISGMIADLKSWRLRDDERIFDEEHLDVFIEAATA